MTDFRPLAREEVDSLPQWDRTEEQLADDLLVRQERAFQLQNRWLLGLAVANGGALTALSSKLLDDLTREADDRVAAAFALAYPSLWFFVVGFALVGVAALMEMIGNMQTAAQLHRSLRVRQHHPEGRTSNALNLPGFWAWLPEIASAVCFLAGLTYPLIVLAIRYWRDSGFIW